MLKNLILLLSLASAGLLTAGAADAKKRDRDWHDDAKDRSSRSDRNEGRMCEKMISVEGGFAFTRGGAEKKAKEAWRQSAMSRHGILFGGLEKAYTDPNLGHDNPECGQASVRWKCTYTAAPCRK